MTFSLLRTGWYCNGQWLEIDRTYDVTNPADNSVVA